MIKLVTDSGVSLPQSVLQEHDIRIVPATLQWGTEMIRDDTLTPAQFYERLAAEPAPPIGRDPLPKDFTDIYQKILEESPMKTQILSLHVSDSLATTLTMSRNAARAMGEVLPQQVHRRRAYDRFLRRGEGEVKTRHGLEEVHDRASARGHDDAEDRKEALLHGGLLEVNALGSGHAAAGERLA